jgi:hypothetical protein
MLLEEGVEVGEQVSITLLAHTATLLGRPHYVNVSNEQRWQRGHSAQPFDGCLARVAEKKGLLRSIRPLRCTDSATPNSFGAISPGASPAPARVAHLAWAVIVRATKAIRSAPIQIRLVMSSSFWRGTCAPVHPARGKRSAIPKGQMERGLTSWAIWIEHHDHRSLERHWALAARDW